MLEHASHDWEAIRVSRHEHQPQLRIPRAQGAVSGQGQRLLWLLRAAGQEDDVRAIDAGQFAFVGRRLYEDYLTWELLFYLAVHGVPDRGTWRPE